MKNNSSNPSNSYNARYAPKYHLVHETTTCVVYPPCSFDGSSYLGSPNFCGDRDSCRDWLYERDLPFVEVFRGFVVPQKFVADLVQLADSVRLALNRVMNRERLHLVSDCFFRHSNRRCYFGNISGCARLVGYGDLSEAQPLLIRLIGISEAAYELGFILSYDEAGLHEVSRHSEYVLSLED